MTAWTSVDCSARPGASFLSCRGGKAWLGGHEAHCDLWTVDRGLCGGQGAALRSWLPGCLCPLLPAGAQIPVTLSRAGEEL